MTFKTKRKYEVGQSVNKKRDKIHQFLAYLLAPKNGTGSLYVYFFKEVWIILTMFCVVWNSISHRGTRVNISDIAHSKLFSQRLNDNNLKISRNTPMQPVPMRDAAGPFLYERGAVSRRHECGTFAGGAIGISFLPFGSHPFRTLSARSVLIWSSNDPELRE